MINKIVRYLTQYFLRLKFALASNVYLGRNVTLSWSTKLKIYLGGKITVGDKSELFEGVILATYGGQIDIGYGCSINPYVVIYGHGGTKIGNNVLIGGHTMIIPGNHNHIETNRPINKQGITGAGIIIEDDVWIAHACSVLDGVTIGKGSIIGAGTVVTKSIPPFSIVMGVPGKIVSNRLIS